MQRGELQIGVHGDQTWAYFLERRAMAPRMMFVYRTQANPNYLDLSINPSERATGSMISPRPDLANYVGVQDLAASSLPIVAIDLVGAFIICDIDLFRQPAQFTVPTLVVGANGDHYNFPFRREGGVRGFGCEGQAIGVYRGRRSLHASGWEARRTSAILGLG